MFSFIRHLEDEAGTIKLGQEISLFARKGLFICLTGDLGAGKTTLARGLIRAMKGSGAGADMDVPSPTFALVQPYDDLRIPVYHFDLYRTSNADEAFELGLFDDLETRITLVEWPERLEGELPQDQIEIELTVSNTGRSVKVSGIGTSADIVERIDVVYQFLTKTGFETSERTFLLGDASARRYERLYGQGAEQVILMDMPETVNGPIVKDGKTYGQIARLAQDVVAVAAINKGLRQAGLSAPETLAADFSNGLMVIEDFKDQVYGPMIKSGQDISEPLKAATLLLANLADQSWPEKIKLDHGFEHTIGPFDDKALGIEVELLLDWFWPLRKNESAPESIRQAFLAAWENTFTLFVTDKPVWVMRDYHSPNLIWLADREDDKRVGLIDTQDCVLGHPAYDLVSLLQDARVDLPHGSEAKLLDFYLSRRQQLDANFDAEHFLLAYAGLGAQRATKVLGIFARLYTRDNKPGYLQHIPRASKALDRNLAHPGLSEIAGWYQQHFPANERVDGNGTVLP